MVVNISEYLRGREEALAALRELLSPDNRQLQRE
jgi:hypothetical protein